MCRSRSIRPTPTPRHTCPPPSLPYQSARATPPPSQCTTGAHSPHKHRCRRRRRRRRSPQQLRRRRRQAASQLSRSVPWRVRYQPWRPLQNPRPPRPKESPRGEPQRRAPAAWMPKIGCPVACALVPADSRRCRCFCPSRLPGRNGQGRTERGLGRGEGGAATEGGQGAAECRRQVSRCAGLTTLTAVSCCPLHGGSLSMDSLLGSDTRLGLLHTHAIKQHRRHETCGCFVPSLIALSLLELRGLLFPFYHPSRAN